MVLTQAGLLSFIIANCTFIKGYQAEMPNPLSPLPPTTTTTTKNKQTQNTNNLTFEIEDKNEDITPSWLELYLTVGDSWQQDATPFL